MPRRTKKIYGKKPIQKKRFYTKRYGGDYSENIKGLLHDVAGTLSEDIAMKTTEMIENRLNADFGEKVATKAADKVIISMAQVFQDAASKISQNPISESPVLISPDLGQIEETPTEQSYMNEPPVVEESPTEENPPPTEEVNSTEEVSGEQGPPPPQMKEPAQNGEGNVNPESNEIPQIEPKKVGGKSRYYGRVKKRMSRNKRNLDTQYQSQYY
jgi:hypothetical protein